MEKGGARNVEISMWQSKSCGDRNVEKSEQRERKKREEKMFLRVE